MSSCYSRDLPKKKSAKYTMNFKLTLGGFLLILAGLIAIWICLLKTPPHPFIGNIGDIIPIIAIVGIIAGCTMMMIGRRDLLNPDK